MALWGTKDSKAVTGTIAVTDEDTAVIGTGTAFTTELKPGQTLVIGSDQYRIESITDDENLDLTNPFDGATASGLTVTARELPAYVQDADRASIFGIDVVEADQLDNKEIGINTPGWGKYTTYTDGNGNVRHKFESMVAMGSITGDANDDTVIVDRTITITTQPEDSNELTGSATSFTVVASVSPTTTLTYQWQDSADGTTFADIVGATTDTYSIADNTGLDGTFYRVIVSASGANSVTSEAALLTEVAP